MKPNFATSNFDTLKNTSREIIWWVLLHKNICWRKYTLNGEKKTIPVGIFEFRFTRYNRKYRLEDILHWAAFSLSLPVILAPIKRIVSPLEILWSIWNNQRCPQFQIYKSQNVTWRKISGTSSPTVSMSGLLFLIFLVC